MSDLVQILTSHAAKYPLMQPCDAVKLIYQNEFGGGHLIKDESSSLLRLEEEFSVINSCTYSGNVTAESIGNSHSRLYLSGIDTDKLPLFYFNRIFATSSEMSRGSIEAFITKLDMLLNLSKQQDVFNFSYDDLAAYLDEYSRMNYPMVSHSEIYRRNYSPAYRVINTCYAKLIPVICDIIRILNAKGHVNIAIEGNAASGKTTVSSLLSRLFPSDVIHMDDFFLPPDLRSDVRYSEIGGNIHYERFQAEVLVPLSSGTHFSYRVFDCHEGDYTGAKSYSPKPVNIIEGVYSLHPKLDFPYDYKIFMSADPVTQKNRIIKRNGEKVYRNFADIWIPLENKYFGYFSIREKCDCILKL